MNKLGRNDPCWCGSGKKYKKCHLAIDNRKNKDMFSFKKNPKKWVKDQETIDKMRLAGSFNGQLMDFIRPHVTPGANTEQLDKLIHDYTRDHGHIPACLGYQSYPKSSCISVNEVVCHGIPSQKITLKEGDIVNVDLTSIVEGCHGDQSETFLIGQVSEKAQTLTIHTANALVKAINIVKPGQCSTKIGEVIEEYIRPKGYGIVQDYTGHGIGVKFHEEPQIYHFCHPYLSTFNMEPGMTFTIEPMINEGTYEVLLDKQDGWTVRTKDLKLSAQFEHTLLVTDTGVEVLTLTPSQKEAGKILSLSDLEENQIVT